MAAWLKTLRLPALAVLAALALHLLGLIGIGSQMQTPGTALAQKNDPLFTRTIEAATPPADAPPPQPVPAVAPAKKTPRPAAAISQPTFTETVAALATPTAKEIAPEITTPTPTQVVSTTDTTPANVTLTAQATTPTQDISQQPSGQTNTLLATGEWPGDTRVSYKLTGYFQGELFGSGQVQWTREGTSNERYQVRVTVDAGLYELRMTSQGRVSPEGLLPEQFEEYSKRVFANPRIRPLKFEANELVLQGDRRVPRPAAEPLAVQDSVSQFIDLGHRFQHGRAKLEAGGTVRIWLGRPGGLDEWVYDIGAAETMQLPRIGEITVHLLKPRPLATPRGTITVSMWLAPSLQYLPAKIRIQLNPEAYAELIADTLQQR